MSEIEIVRIPVTPAHAAPLIAALNAARTGYLAPPACLGVDVTAKEGEVIAVIRWASAKAHKAAGATPQAGALFAAVQKLAADTPSLETLPGHSPSGRLAGQVALVTGGGSGIGRAVVDRFVAEGAHVAVVDRNSAGLIACANHHGDRVTTIEADLATLDGNQQAIKQTIAAFGTLDCYIANAGLFDGFIDFAAVPLEQLDAGFDAIFNVNTRGLILGCRAALPHLVRSRGSIIVTLSNAALYPDGGGVLYVASKHAALGVVRQLAHELAPTVRVNAVAPGATKTPIGVPELLGSSQDQTTPEASAAISKLVPLRRHAEPQDHASAYVLLAARQESASMTGTIIESDGGLGVRGLRRTCGGDDLGKIAFQ